jgi:hypothetical protein
VVVVVLVLIVVGVVFRALLVAAGLVVVVVVGDVVGDVVFVVVVGDVVGDVVFVVVVGDVANLAVAAAVVLVEGNCTVGIGFTAALLSNVTPFKKKVMWLTFESVNGAWGMVGLEGTLLLAFDTMNPKGSVTPVVPKPLRLNWYLAQVLVNVTFLLITANFKSVKIFGLVAGVLEGLPIARKATLSPPNSPFAKKTTLCTSVRSSV